ncbi:MAG: hypothetical protein FJY98_04365 [Candidatus Liptonbacteria bacterium]|nr:hypothetical protein [Candidatus Liptonbacteria bacterium]
MKTNLKLLVLLLLPYHAAIGATVTLTSTDQPPMFVPEGARAPGGEITVSSLLPIPPLELHFGVEGIWQDIEKVVVLSNNKLLGEAWMFESYPITVTNSHAVIATNTVTNPTATNAPPPQPTFDPNTGVTLTPITDPFFIDILGTNRSRTTLVTNTTTLVVTQRVQLDITLPVIPSGSTPIQYFMDVKNNIATNGGWIKLTLLGISRGTNVFLQGRLPNGVTHTLVRTPQLGSGELESVMLSHTIRRGTNNTIGAVFLKGGVEPRQVTLPVEFHFQSFHWARIDNMAAVVNGQIITPRMNGMAGTHPFRDDVLILREVFRNIPVPAEGTRIYFIGTVHGDIQSRAGTLSATSLASEWLIRGLHSNTLIVPHAEGGGVSSTVVVGR